MRRQLQAGGLLVPVGMLLPLRGAFLTAKLKLQYAAALGNKPHDASGKHFGAD